MPEEVDVQPESSPGEGVTQASPPATADPLQEAIDKGDYATYERLSNASDIGKGEPSKIAAPSKGEPAPASQPVKQQEPPKPQGRPPKPNARSDRIQELLAENSALRKQLESAPGVTPAPPPAPTPTPAPPPAAAAPKPEPPKDDPEPVLEKKPDGSRWKDYDEYRNEWKAWDRREAKREALAEITANQQKEAETRLHALWMNRVEAIAQDPEYPDYRTIAFNKNVSVNKVTEGFLYTSEQGPKILYHLGKNPAIAAQLAQQDAYNTMRFLVQLEHSLAPKPEPPKPEIPAPTKQTTRMKPPASELSGRNTPPADEMEAAVARGDYRAYERLANSADLASIRGR